MTDYIGKICPYCKTELKADDEIVVCSQCDMPHHKECWIDNQGCTTFGCLGTIESPDNHIASAAQSQPSSPHPGATIETPVAFCPKCGAKTNAGAAFCSACGNMLSANTGAMQPQRAQSATAYNPSNYNVNYNSNYNTNSYPYTGQQNTLVQGYGQPYQSMTIDPDVIKLIGPKAEYYIPKFQELKNYNKQTSWNWPAFLFTAYWMIYRKMYGFGAAIIGTAFFLSLFGSAFISLLSLVAYIVLGIYANDIYMKFLEKKASCMKTMSEPYKSMYAAQNGGVNTVAVVITIISYYILLFFISLIFLI